MIDRLIRAATGLRAAIAVSAFGLIGFPIFRASPYSSLKDLAEGASLPEETVTTPRAFTEFVDALGAAGRQTYLEFQVWDLLNPTLIGIAGAMLLGWLLKRGRREDARWKYVIVLPVAALCADLAENLVIATGVGSFPEVGLVVHALPVVTAIKFAAVIGMLASIVALCGLWARTRLLEASPS